MSRPRRSRYLTNVVALIQYVGVSLATLYLLPEELQSFYDGARW